MKSLTSSKLLAIATLAATLSCATSANATIVTYVASDVGATNAATLVNSTAKAAEFAAALPGSTLISFESALPSGVSVTGATNTAGNCGSPADLYGFNVTAGGNTVRCRTTSVPVVFTFSSPIDSFGLFVTGLQNNVGVETLSFSDGTNQTITLPSITSGGAFIGFTDFGRSITSVTYNAAGDSVGIDDVRYRLASSAVPEPGSIALLGLGALGLVSARRRKSA